MKNWKRCTTLLLTTVLCAALLPMPAAAEPEEVFLTEAEEGVAETEIEDEELLGVCSHPKLSGYVPAGTDTWQNKCLNCGEYYTLSFEACGSGYAITGMLSNTLGGEIEIPSTINGQKVIAIGKAAFVNTSSIEKIILPSTLTDIDDYAFRNCDNLVNVYIPDSVTYIGKCAFENCDSLTNVEIGINVEHLYEKAFNDCMNMTRIVVPGHCYDIREKAFGYVNGEVSGDLVAYVIKTTGGHNYSAEYGIRYVLTGQPMNRVYNPNSGEHFYTADNSERVQLVNLGWQYEGTGWFAPMNSTNPVYRLYNPNAGDHHYTKNAAEKDMLVAFGWNYEGIGWYSDDFETIPLYRQYNPNAVAGSHNYTTNKAENDMLVILGWQAEGIGWYGVKG